MALTKSENLEKQSEKIEAAVETQPVKKFEERKPDKIIVLEHPKIRGNGSVGLFLRGEEISFEFKEGKYSFENKKENLELRDALVADGWVDLTYYAHERKTPFPELSKKKISEWIYKHPLGTDQRPINGGIGIFADGKEFDIKIKESKIQLYSKENSSAESIAMELEKQGYILIDSR